MIKGSASTFNSPFSHVFRSIVDFNPENDIVVAPHYHYDENDVAEINLTTSPRDLGHDERGIANHGKTFDQILEEELAKENQIISNQDDSTGNWDEKKRRENQQYIVLFGEQFVRNAISKKHADRLLAVEELKQVLHI